MPAKSDSQPTDPSELFQVVGRYLLSPRIAAGGMATVHVARTLSTAGFSRTVALKRMHQHLLGETDLVRMFRDEARVSMQIRHANVVPTLDVVEENDELMLVMEYIHGESLSHLVAAARNEGAFLPCNMVSAILVGALQGLHAAHETRSENGDPLNIVHRDFTPQNVMVGADGQTRVTDFGVAKAKGRLHTTDNGIVRGKLAYMAPEQLGGKFVDARSDVYAAGVVLWEALTGQALFSGEDTADIVFKVLHQEIAPPSQICPRVSEVLDAIVLRALARDPDGRFPSAREMARAIEIAERPMGATDLSERLLHYCGKKLARRANIVRALERHASDVAEERKSLADSDSRTNKLLPHPPKVDQPILKQRAEDHQLASVTNTPLPTTITPLPTDIPRPTSSPVLTGARPIPLGNAMSRVEDSPTLPPPIAKVHLNSAIKKRTNTSGSATGPLLFLLVMVLAGGVIFIKWDHVEPIVDHPLTAPSEIGCWTESGSDCFELGRRYEQGLDVSVNMPRAHDLYDRACKLANSDGCVGLAMLDDEKLKVTPAKKLELLQRACNAGNSNGCTTLGNMLLDSDKPDDREKGVGLMQAACDQYNVESCSQLGSLLLDGKRLEQDINRARALCERACAHHDVQGCACVERIAQREARDR